MIAEEAAKGIAVGLRDYIKRSLTITTLGLLLAGASFAVWQLLAMNAQDRKEYKEEIKTYSDALRTANRLVMEVQQDIARCMADRQKQAAEIFDLQYQVRALKEKMKR
jgi:hypothetical protein